MRTNGLLQYQIVDDGYEADNGDYIQGDSHWSDAIKCFAEPSSTQAYEKMFEDGVVRSYSFAVYMLRNARTFNIGEKVRLHRMGKIYELEVKGFMAHHIRNKIWIG